MLSLSIINNLWDDVCSALLYGKSSTRRGNVKNITPLYFCDEAELFIENPLYISEEQLASMSTDELLERFPF